MLKMPSSSGNSDVEGPLVTTNFTTTNNENTKTLLSYHERLQLEEQIRKFVQLVTQSYLLSCGNSDFKVINESSKQILMELKDIALQNNMFSAHNLTAALDIVKDYENVEEIHSDFRSNYRKGIPHSVKKIIFNSKVFMYPELLPKHGFIRKQPQDKVIFTKAEDNLIAMGLEKFSGKGTEVYDIQTHFLPCKKVPQIKIRIKNLRASKSPKDNPVKYYYDHRKAPPMPRNVQEFDPNKVRAPKDAIEDLPNYFMPFVLKAKSCSIKRPKITQQIAPKFVEPPFILPKPIIVIPNNNIIKVQKIYSVHKPPFILPKSLISKSMNSNLENDTDISSECTISEDNTSKKSNLEGDTNINTNCIIREDNTEMTNLEVDLNNNNCLVGKTRQSDSKNDRHLNTKCESKQDFVLKDNDALDKVVVNKSSENMNSKNKLKKRLDKVIRKSLLMTDGKNSKNKKCNSSSSINLINNKCFTDSTTEKSMDECNITSPKKKEISITLGYFPNHVGKVHEKLDDFEAGNHKLPSTNSVVTKSVEIISASSDKDCNIIIKSEFVEEISDSSQNACLKSCKTEKMLNSGSLDDCSDEQKPHFAENKIENKDINTKALSEMTSNADKYNQNVNNSAFLYKSKIKTEETFCKISRNVNGTFLPENNVNIQCINFFADSKTEYTDNIIKSEIIEGICDSSPNVIVKDCETAKVSNSNSLSEHCNEQNSNFVISETRTKDTENAKNFSEITKVFHPQYFHHIKQEIEDDFEIVMASESVHDINTNKYNVLTKNITKYNIDKQHINNIKYTLNNNKVNKTVEYIPDPNDKEYGVIIKSEIVEENSDSLEDDINKIDFDLMPLSVDSNLMAKDSLTKQKLISDNLSSMNKRNKISHDNFDTITEFPELSEQQHDFYQMQKLENNNKITNNIFVENMAAYNEEIPIKSEIIPDKKTLLTSSDVVMQKNIFSKRKRNVTKSNSLERAHLKIYIEKTTSQSRGKRKCHAKRKTSKRKKS